MPGKKVIRRITPWCLCVFVARVFTAKQKEKNKSFGFVPFLPQSHKEKWQTILMEYIHILNHNQQEILPK
jgi:hypothetical protein